jgi:hypothetical protein
MRSDVIACEGGVDFTWGVGTVFWTRYEFKSMQVGYATQVRNPEGPCSRQLTAAEAARWSDPAFVQHGWVPFTIGGSR